MARNFPNSGANFISLGNPTALDPSGLSMTVGCWINLAGTAAQRWLSRGLSTGLKGWAFGIATSGGDLQFSKYGVADITSAIALSTGSWLYVAAVVQATQIHFFQMTAAGVVTTGNVANSGAFGAGANNAFVGAEVINSVSTKAKPANGKLAELAVWIGSQLTDTELRAAALGVNHVGIQPTFYMPLLGDSPEPDYSGNKIAGTVTSTTIVPHPPTRPLLFGPGRGFQPMPV